MFKSRKCPNKETITVEKMLCQEKEKIIITPVFEFKGNESDC